MPAHRNYITRISMTATDPLVQAALQAHLRSWQRNYPDTRLMETTITLVLRSTYLPGSASAPLGTTRREGDRDGDTT